MWDMFENQCAKYFQSQQKRHNNSMTLYLLLTSEVWVFRTQSNIYDWAFFAKIVDKS